ncbi:hypothetical protein [Butyrivibrio sp. FC2001]|jgi:hypothetical protein|uniref:hypothetical protein n=1 Tax=Butyrivibrio sp. FC2001 TaxID=1280671 RepID=UPI001A997E40|nr:hypothetical protein [Butyrivibrio sp. FC2001]
MIMQFIQFGISGEIDVANCDRILITGGLFCDVRETGEVSDNIGVSATDSSATYE